jgi:hypothetical protein
MATASAKKGATVDVSEVWADTGQAITRPPTAEEAQQRADDDAAAQAAAQAAAAAATAQAAAAAAAIEHAKSLGFTDQMIAAMYPNLVTP